ncbi:MAG: hypothetical protein E3J64_08595 [Anaerolineales bacterium]|nr:MAG: hypothetical protein E3J64_08595 [Anaerolineales bacterium]
MTVKQGNAVMEAPKWWGVVGALLLVAVLIAVQVLDLRDRPYLEEDVWVIAAVGLGGILAWLPVHEGAHVVGYMVKGVAFRDTTRAYLWRVVPRAVGTRKCVGVGAVRASLVAVLVATGAISAAGLWVLCQRGVWERGAPRLSVWLALCAALFGAWNDLYWLWMIRKCPPETRFRDLQDRLEEC